MPLHKEVVVARRETVGSLCRSDRALEAIHPLCGLGQDKCAVSKRIRGRPTLEVPTPLATVHARGPVLDTIALIAVGGGCNTVGGGNRRPRIYKAQGTRGVHLSAVGELQGRGVRLSHGSLRGQNVEVACTLAEPVILPQRPQCAVDTNHKANHNCSDAENPQHHLRIVAVLVVVADEEHGETNEDDGDDPQHCRFAMCAPKQIAKQDDNQEGPRHEH
mmetsp:Transcript_72157/g.167221  ORF Transcript_72157/g.167221 Transcript_72157/m.167221 type:complete len:218 (+) Transcript_72157:238-891(+)